ncbi:MAG TPA: hypothetical protein VHF27_14160 [Acidimicrobiales bacterium]|nr:hypothetical protein [Acidimicrobiales bacterium]
MTAAFVDRAGDTARTMGRVIFVDPVRQGRLRLDGLPPLVHQLAVLGVVALAASLVSLVFTDLWRRGPLTFVNDFEASPILAARGVVAFTVVTLAAAWLLILAGGSLARPPVAVLAGVAFLLFNSALSDSFADDDTAALRLLGDAVPVAYFLAPGLAVALSLLRRTEGVRFVRPVLGVALAAATVGFFAANLAVYVIELRDGGLAGLPRLLDNAMNEMQTFLVPLFVLAVAALVQLNHHIARAATAPFWGVSARVAKVSVLVLIAVKLRYGLVGRADFWGAYLTERRPQALQALAFLLLAAGAAWLFSRIGGDEGEVSTEGLLYAAALLLSVTVLVGGVVTSSASFVGRLGWDDASGWVVDNFPYSFLTRYLLVAVFTALLLVGLLLYVRPRRPPWGRRTGAVLILIGAWIVPCLFLQQLSDRDVGFDIGLVDLGFTVAALAWLVFRWRRVDGAGAVRVGTLLVFLSLVAGNGYVATRLVTRVLAFFTPPAVLLIVLGVVYVLLADSSFASYSSHNFPRPTRVLLWLGYVIFVVAVANYVLVAREVEYRIEFDRFAFHLLALPIAVWLAVRSPPAPPEPQPAEDEPG